MNDRRRDERVSALDTCIRFKWALVYVFRTGQSGSGDLGWGQKCVLRYYNTFNTLLLGCIKGDVSFGIPSLSLSRSLSLSYSVSILHSTELFITRPPPLWIYRARKSVISEAGMCKALGHSYGFPLCCILLVVRLVMKFQTPSASLSLCDITWETHVIWDTPGIVFWSHILGGILNA